MKELLFPPFCRWKSDDQRDEETLPSICCFDAQNQFPYPTFFPPNKSIPISTLDPLIMHSYYMCLSLSSRKEHVAQTCAIQSMHFIPLASVIGSGMHLSGLRLLFELLGWESSVFHWAWTWKHLGLELLVSILSPSGA